MKIPTLLEAKLAITIPGEEIGEIPAAQAYRVFQSLGETGVIQVNNQAKRNTEIMGWVRGEGGMILDYRQVEFYSPGILRETSAGFAFVGNTLHTITQPRSVAGLSLREYFRRGERNRSRKKLLVDALFLIDRMYQEI